MRPEDLAQAAAEAEDDLATIEAAGVEPETLEAALNAERDDFADLDCDFGDGLAEELRDWPDG